jgi:RHS repeat-associated protein
LKSYQKYDYDNLTRRTFDDDKTPVFTVERLIQRDPAPKHSASSTATRFIQFALYEAYGTRPSEYEWSDGVTGDPDRQKANTKEEETDLGLLNEGMRYRDLDTGTFLTRDPIGYKDGPNIYCYVHCNPITQFDPLGLEVHHKKSY